MNSAIATLNDWINASNNIVFFGGAGVSTEAYPIALRFA